MSLTSQIKAEVIAKYQRAPGDTGSPETQVALLSANIAKLTEHFQAYPKDHHSRRGLLEMVNKRRKLLAYLKRVNSQRYQQLIEELGLRG
jgi:small subunit ribosomal protein S15